MNIVWGREAQCINLSGTSKSPCQFMSNVHYFLLTTCYFSILLGCSVTLTFIRVEEEHTCSVTHETVLISVFGWLEKNLISIYKLMCWSEWGKLMVVQIWLGKVRLRRRPYLSCTELFFFFSRHMQQAKALLFPTSCCVNLPFYSTQWLLFCCCFFVESNV